MLRSNWNPVRHLEFDVNAFWYGTTMSAGYMGHMLLPAYTRLDARIGYKLGPHWSLSLTGQTCSHPATSKVRPKRSTPPAM